MDISFHHTTTYVLARLAGFQHPEARVIAYAAQYVDDARATGTIRFSDGTTFDRIATAHFCHLVPPEDLPELLENYDNHLNAEALVPFHFLPGNLGLGVGQGQAAPMINRLLCTADSEPAAHLRRACIDHRGAANQLQRLGITAHVYADTWAHQGFLGLDHPLNRIQGLLHPAWSFSTLLQDSESKLAGLMNVGHAMALTLPDEPFLSWGYRDRDGNLIKRDNWELFSEAAARLVGFFLEFRGEDPAEPLRPADQDAIRNAFREITDPVPLARQQAWLARLATDTFSFGALKAAELADLEYQPEGPGSWEAEALAGSGVADPVFATSDWKHFQDAAREHRAEVMERILPAFGLALPRARPQGSPTSVQFELS
jgi:hypothetical protein